MYSKEAYPHLVEVLQITSEVLLIWETFLVERGRIMTCLYFPNENPVSSSYTLHLMTDCPARWKAVKNFPIWSFLFNCQSISSKKAMNKRLKFNGFPIKTSRQSGICKTSSTFFMQWFANSHHCLAKSKMNWYSHYILVRSAEFIFSLYTK